MVNKTVSVIGLGHVGLPLALFVAAKGYSVRGLDVVADKVELINSGKMPFIEEGAEELLRAQLGKNFTATTDFAEVKDSRIIILTLGTPIDENMNPVYSQIDAVLGEIFRWLTKGQLILLRSTVSPATTEYLAHEIEKNTQLVVGQDIFLAFCPERIAEGKSLSEMSQLPQIVGGFDPESTAKAARFFKSLGITCLTTDATSAELAKLFTNMYRYINFAIANEFMVIADKYDRNAHEITRLVNTGYKRGGLALPGLTAGPCLFKDGFFLINDFPFIDLIATSWKINESIPLFLIDKLKQITHLYGKKVTILGLAFKPEIDDIRESLSFKLRKALIREHAEVTLHDPYVDSYANQPIVHQLKRAVDQADVVIVAMRHTYYRKHLARLLAEIKPTAYICDIWNLFETNKIVFRRKELN